LAEPVVRVPCSVWRASGYARGERAIPEETAVAFTYNTASYAVMMATPLDLKDFAVGFSLTEGVISSIDAIESVEIVEDEIGIELRIWLKSPDAAEFLTRRRKMAGPTGCGLCGIESLTEAMRPPPQVREGLGVTPAEIMTAIESLFPLQELNRETRAVHGAGFFDPARGLVAVRGDVGRHNALDKLAGALAREGTAVAKGHRGADQPRLGRDGAEICRHRRAHHRRGVGADRACAPHGRGLRHDAGGRCSQGWVRGVHPRASHRRGGCRSCRYGGSPNPMRQSLAILRYSRIRRPTQ
jgi:FdhD protein